MKINRKSKIKVKVREIYLLLKMRFSPKKPLQLRKIDYRTHFVYFTIA